MTKPAQTTHSAEDMAVLQRVLHENIRIIRKSGLFDTAYYTACYADVAQLGLNAIEHYVCYGSAEGRNPAPWFDSALYLEFYPHIAQKNINPFVHYIHSGKTEGFMAFAVGDSETLIQQARAHMQNREQEADYFAALYAWTQLSMRFPALVAQYKAEIEMCFQQGLQYYNTSSRSCAAPLVKPKSPLALLVAEVKKAQGRAETDIQKKSQQVVLLWQNIGRLLPQSSTQTSSISGSVKKPVAIFFSHEFLLSFYANLVRAFAPEHLDIVFDVSLFASPQMQEAQIQKYDFTPYTTHTGLEHLQNYEAVILDPYSFEVLPQLSSFFAQHTHIKTVVLSHSMDAKVAVRPWQHCLLVGCEKQTRQILRAQEGFFLEKEFLQGQEQVLASVAPQAKMEVAYTGPHHMDAYLQSPAHMQENKRRWRQEIEQALGCRFEKSKKVVVVFVDEASHKKHLIAGVNALAKHAHVILKVLHTEEAYLKRLSPQVHLWKDIGLAPNTLRFGADVIMAGYKSGTFFSSCMLGLLVLPFYARYENPRLTYGATQSATRTYAHHMESWLRFMAYAEDLPAPAVLTQYFLQHGKTFDVLHTQSLVDALYGKKYAHWYHGHIHEVQKRVFGCYTLEGVGKQTMQYILQFATQGSLGENCASVYLRPEYCVK